MHLRNSCLVDLTTSESLILEVVGILSLHDCDGKTFLYKPFFNQKSLASSDLESVFLPRNKLWSNFLTRRPSSKKKTKSFLFFGIKASR